MNKPPRQQEFPVVSGPSKFDFLQTIGFRKHPTQRVIFKLDINDQIVEAEVEILAIMPDGGVEDGDGGESHNWRFYTSAPWIKNERGRQEQLRFNLIGSYSTRTRRGWVRPIGHHRSLLVYAAFEQGPAIEDLRAAGYKLPPNDSKP